jgi:glycerophosphoryl diester phosphodiesterase
VADGIHTGSTDYCSIMIRPLIIGHRGASAVAPENTLLAFERALSNGADGIEFDVRLARDGVPVVIHDATLRRTALREGDVSSLSSDELSEIDVGTWFNLRHRSEAAHEYSRATIPTLAEVLELFGGARLYVEMKCEAKECGSLASEVARLVRAHSLFDRVVVESFALDSIKEIKRLDPEIRTAALFEPRLTRPRPLPRKMIEQAIAHAADEIAPHRTLVTRRLVEEARQRGMNVVVWTVDSPSWIGRAISDGIYAIITNRPADMRAERDSQQPGVA